MWWARFHVLRALIELRAPGVARLLLDCLRDSDEDDHTISEDCIETIPTLDPAECAIVIAELRDRPTSKHYNWRANTLTEIVENIATEHPALRDACLDAIRKQLQNHPANNPTYNGFLVDALLHCKAVEFAPLIEQAYTAGTVDEDICGDLEDVQIALGLRKERSAPRPTPYANAFRLSDDDDDADNDDTAEEDAEEEEDNNNNDDDESHKRSASDDFQRLPPAFTPIRNAAPKVGRNDPCPCGSGKKYKKCCMDKDLAAKG